MSDPNQKEELLRQAELLKTATRIRDQIKARFKEAGLSNVAALIVKTTEEAEDTAKAIARTDWRVFAGQALVVVLAVVGVVAYFQSGQNPKPVLQTVTEFLDSAKGSAAILVAAGAFLFTLGRWRKRGRVLRAIHKLRALAHLVDMHQLSKNPTRLGQAVPSHEVAGQPLDAESMRLYLHFCTELLAVVGKLGQLYVQEFSDSTALAAVDQFEELAMGLSSKIWQKLMILDRVTADASHCPTPVKTVTASSDGFAPKTAAK